MSRNGPLGTCIHRNKNDNKNTPGQPPSEASKQASKKEKKKLTVESKSQASLLDLFYSTTCIGVYCTFFIQIISDTGGRVLYIRACLTALMGHALLAPGAKRRGASGRVESHGGREYILLRIRCEADFLVAIRGECLRRQGVGPTGFGAASTLPFRMTHARVLLMVTRHVTPSCQRLLSG